MVIGHPYLIPKKINNIQKNILLHFESSIYLYSSDKFIKVDLNNQNLNTTILNILKSNKQKDLDLIYFDSVPSIVPFEFFDENSLDKYLETNIIKGENTLFDNSFDNKLKIVYSYNDFIDSNLFKKEKIIFNQKNYFTQLYDFIINNNSNQSYIKFYINFHKNSFDVFVTKSNELILFNNFKINNENEFLYYLFFVIKNFEGQEKSNEIIFIGNFEDYIDYYELVSKYNKIEFILDDLNEEQIFPILNENYIRI
ncbi:MAG: DUF3822 family protein [Bacteroidota bacterium]